MKIKSFNISELHELQKLLGITRDFLRHALNNGFLIYEGHK